MKETYIKGHTYWVVGPRNAWDTVNVGLFMSKDAAHGQFPMSKPDIIRNATESEIKEYFNL
jgi:hypothetical protein